MNDPLISLIIPCYNAERTVSKCLDSVTNQIYKNLEIIIINDGSTDGTLEIIKQFQKEDSRLIVIDQTNSGVSKARNLGIQKAGGEYICFVDSDDWVEKDYCSVLYKTLVENEADISIVDVIYENEKGHPTFKQDFDNSIHNYHSQKALELLLEDRIIKSYPCSKLFKKETFDNVVFPRNLEAFEDYYVMFRIFNNSTKIVKINQPLYHYIQFENSLSHNLTPKRAYHFFLALMEAFRFLETQNIEPNHRNFIMRNILKKKFMVLKRIIRNTTSEEMSSEKEIIRNQMLGFLNYSVIQIGIENYFYLRFYVNFPNQYQKFLKRKK